MYISDGSNIRFRIRKCEYSHVFFTIRIRRKIKINIRIHEYYK